MIPDNNVPISDDLKERMGLAGGDFPSAEEIRAAQLKFACTREDDLVAYKEKMEAGEDLYAAEVLDGLLANIMSAAFQGEVMTSFQWSFASERPRHSDQNVLYMDMPIQYSDSTFHSLSDYLDAMTYMHALCEFLYDELTSPDKGYEITPTRQYGRRPPVSQDEEKMTREDIIRAAFSESRNDSFAFVVSWGSDEFKEAVQKMETMAQYDSYAAGVPLEDILA